MTDTFTVTGKEVLRNGIHFADVIDDEGAQEIIRAISARASIATWIEQEAAKRKTASGRRIFRLIADGVRNRFDEPDEEFS